VAALHIHIQREREREHVHTHIHMAHVDMRIKCCVPHTCQIK
jgi:hypothetical protein